VRIGERTKVSELWDEQFGLSGIVQGYSRGASSNHIISDPLSSDKLRDDDRPQQLELRVLIARLLTQLAQLYSYKATCSLDSTVAAIAFSFVTALRRLTSISNSFSPRASTLQASKAVLTHPHSTMASLGGYEKQHRVTVVGSGNWGSAIAKICAQCTKEHPDLFEEEVKMCRMHLALHILVLTARRGL